MTGRREDRFDASLAVILDKGEGVTRNVSASGVYFETDLPLTQGAAISFALKFDDAPGGPLLLKCEAHIVRVDRKGSKMGVGAAIKTYKFERAAAGTTEPA